MSHKEKTLSERLAELANPTPQFVDPEDEYNEDTKARLESFDEQYEAKEKISKKTLKNKSSLRHKNVELLVVSDKKYAGKRVSRKDLEEENQDDSEESISDAEESDSEDAVNIKEFKKKMMKEVNSRTRKMPPTDYLESNEDGSSEMDEERENGSDLDSLEEEADVDEEEHDDEDDDDDEDDEEEVGSIDDDDDENEGDVKRVSKNPHDSDINKGKAIQNQLSLWDHLLECRIKLHKGLHLTNQLPQAPSNFKLFTKATGENHFVTAGQGAQAAIKTLLDNCLELQDLLLKSNPQTKTLIQRKSNGAKEDSDDEIPSDTDEEVEEDEGQTPKRKKLKVEEYETEIGDRHETFRGFCHRTLNMWNEKTRLASGRTGTGSKSGFGAFDQSILKQIEGILADKQRLVNRTRIKRSTYRVLGCLPKSQDTVKISEEEETLKKKNDATSIENKLIDYEEFDPEIYDDDDFYHQLLRELIEKRTGEAGSNQIALGRQWLEIQKLRSKAKRKVDSKASKGRRLRYEVHPKLVSFMAPFPETSWNDIAKNELFASLFGSGPPVS